VLFLRYNKEDAMSNAKTAKKVEKQEGVIKSEQVAFRVSPGLAKRVDDYARLHGLNWSEVARFALIKFLDEKSAVTSN
jgi:hypothetical protein